MAVLNTWHIHREEILRIGGVALGLASMVIVLSTPHHGDSASEMGMLMGTAFRNVVAGLVVAALATYIWRRVYWYERAPWSRITPEAAALAGMVALALAVALGGPETAATLSSGPG
ncbi:MAG: hypothetical protein QOI31_2495 [Solirubrobacterales bacterium]|nr:hypothetical protein [Solirubrobacterales bacterium]